MALKNYVRIKHYDGEKVMSNQNTSHVASESQLPILNKSTLVHVHPSKECQGMENNSVFGWRGMEGMDFIPHLVQKL